jgi:hypothetical protein
MGKAVKKKSGPVRRFLWPSDMTAREKIFDIFSTIAMTWFLVTGQWLYAGVAFGIWFLVMFVIVITHAWRGK